MTSDVYMLTKAYTYAAEKHSAQRRKGADNIPYINHPIAVAELVAKCNKTASINLLIAAVLHDVIEDTLASPSDIETRFGAPVLQLVLELTDDMSLNKETRRKLQIEKAASISNEAKQIKIADKICNITDILYTRIQWSRNRKVDYIQWATKVARLCGGVNSRLDTELEKTITLCHEMLGEF